MYLYLWLNINLKFRTMKQIGRNVMCGLCTAVTAAAVLLFSCTQGPEPVGPQSGMTIRATTEVTRTALGADYSVVWNEGDSFLLMNDSGSSSMFGLTDGAGERSATFTGDWLDAGSDGMYYAAYPAAGAVYDSGSVAMEIPTGQTYVAGTFASDCNPMVASGSDPESGLAFRNVFGLLELRIRQYGAFQTHVDEQYRFERAGAESFGQDVFWCRRFFRRLCEDGADCPLGDRNGYRYAAFRYASVGVCRRSACGIRCAYRPFVR